MCDYSLTHVASRSAAVGDKLVTTKFGISHGFAAPTDANTAVCVLPGTEIGFDQNIESRATHNTGWEAKTYSHSVGVFRQVDKEQAHMHHDALELPDGTIVKLNDLVEGQSASVLQLPAAPKTEAEAAEQRRLEVVG